MLKHYPKLKRLWKNCERLSKIAHENLWTETFKKELARIVAKEVNKELSTTDLVDYMVLKGQTTSKLFGYLISNLKLYNHAISQINRNGKV